MRRSIHIETVRGCKAPIFLITSYCCEQQQDGKYN